MYVCECIYKAHLSYNACYKWRWKYNGLGKKKRVNHWENDSLSRWDLNLDLNAVTLDSPDMAGGRELPHPSWRLYTWDLDSRSFVSFKTCRLKLRGWTGRSSWFWSVGITGGSHELNSATQFLMVFTGTMISTDLALMLRKITSEKAQTWNVLPKPIEWAKMHPSPGDVENWSKFSTTLS